MWQAITWTNDGYFTDAKMRHSASMSWCEKKANTENMEKEKTDDNCDSYLLGQTELINILLHFWSFSERMHTNH